MEKAEQHNGEVSFGGGAHTAAVGVLGGVAIAVGAPWVLLAYGQILGAPALIWLVGLAVVCGAGLGVVAAFFGLVMPHRVHGGWADPRHLREFAREAQGWSHGRGRGRRWREGNED